jgi:hypothetical protein
MLSRRAAWVPILREDLATNRHYARLWPHEGFSLSRAALAANYVPYTKIYWLVSETIMNLSIAA